MLLFIFLTSITFRVYVIDQSLNSREIIRLYSEHVWFFSRRNSLLVWLFIGTDRRGGGQTGRGRGGRTKIGQPRRRSVSKNRGCSHVSLGVAALFLWSDASRCGFDEIGTKPASRRSRWLRAVDWSVRPRVALYLGVCRASYTCVFV